VAILAALLCASSNAEVLQVALVEQDLITKRLAAGVQPADKREEMARQLFTEAGCETTAQVVNKRASNVICTLPGESEATIIVGAHYDFVERGQGIVDDWSGTSLLPSLYEALKPRRQKYTFIFVAFAAEEEGLVGSRRYVKELTKAQRANVRAFVNLECLGTTDLKVWNTRSTPALINLFAQIASSIGTPATAISLDHVGDDDTHSFTAIKARVISIHSISQKTFPILHTKADTISAISPDLLYTAYRTIAFYLAYLDSKL